MTSEVPLYPCLVLTKANLTLGRAHSVSLQGYLARKKQPLPTGPPKDPRHALRQGPRGSLFLMGEVPL